MKTYYLISFFPCCTWKSKRNCEEGITKCYDILWDEIYSIKNAVELTKGYITVNAIIESAFLTAPDRFTAKT